MENLLPTPYCSSHSLRHLGDHVFWDDDDDDDDDDDADADDDDDVKPFIPMHPLRMLDPSKPIAYLPGVPICTNRAKIEIRCRSFNVASLRVEGSQRVTNDDPHGVLGACFGGERRATVGCPRNGWLPVFW